MRSDEGRTRDNDYLILACPQSKEFNFIRLIYDLCESLGFCRKCKYHSSDVLCTAPLLVVFDVARVIDPTSYCIHRLCRPIITYIIPDRQIL